MMNALNTLPIFDQIALKIIREQELVIGPLAWAQAAKVQGIHITDQKAGVVSVDQGPGASSIIDRLVGQYEKLFGRASREVCKDAAAPLVAELSPADVPNSLR